MPHDASHDDFAVEPIRGLPELPPEGESILWQGSPDWRALALEAFGIRAVAAYFVAIALWRAVAVGAEKGVVYGVERATPLLVLGLIAIGLLLIVAYVQAKATVYTITNRRVAMRIGAALTVTLNLPYRWIGTADLKRGPWGTGTVAMRLQGTTRLSYLVCWPHVRPWRISRTEPALRAIPEAEKVGRILAEAAEARLEEQALSRPLVAALAAE